MGCAMGPASSGNCAMRRRCTSPMQVTARLVMSDVNSCTIESEHAQSSLDLLDSHVGKGLRLSMYLAGCSSFTRSLVFM
jgi:hypothetical protein